MIFATIQLSSMFVDRPQTMVIPISEDTIAVEFQGEDGRLKKVTVGELYDIYKKGWQYFRDSSDPSTHITGIMFEQWFYGKHIHEKGLMQRVISIDYKRA